MFRKSCGASPDESPMPSVPGEVGSSLTRFAARKKASRRTSSAQASAAWAASFSRRSPIRPLPRACFPASRHCSPSRSTASDSDDEAVEAETLRRSDAIKTAILRSVSHDLRSPLTAIRTATEGLENPALDLTEADRAALLATIDVEAKRLDRLVANLLDLSRLELGAAEPKPELWTIESLVGQALSELGAGADRVTVSLAADLPPVEVDGAQVGLVLVNLIDNALEFSSRSGGGSVLNS